MSNNTNNKGGRSSHYCAFCGRNESQANFLIPSPTGIFICDFCVDACADLISETEERVAAKSDSGFTLDTLPRPTQIKTALDEYVIGQDEAKIALAVAVYNHYKRVLYAEQHAPKGKRGKRAAENTEEILFCGSLERHPQSHEIQAFCRAHQKKPISLGDFPLTDVGTIFLI